MRKQGKVYLLQLLIFFPLLLLVLIREDSMFYQRCVTLKESVCLLLERAPQSPLEHTLWFSWALLGAQTALWVLSPHLLKASLDESSQTAHMTCVLVNRQKETNKMQNIYLSVLYKKFPVIKCILQIIEKDKTFGMHILKRKKKKHFEMIKSRSWCSFSEFQVNIFIILSLCFC